MVLSIKDKEDLVIDMLNNNYTLREIASKVHVSFSFISAIRKKLAGEEEIVIDDKLKKGVASRELSIPSQSIQLFKEGKSLIDVAILLDIPKDDVIQNYSDYLILKNMREVAALLQEHKNELSTFLKLFNYLKRNNIKWNNIKQAIDNKVK
jgi:hypothetical protein